LNAVKIILGFWGMKMQDNSQCKLVDCVSHGRKRGARRLKPQKAFMTIPSMN